MKCVWVFMLMVLPAIGGEWVSLFDGKTLTGWTNQGGADFRVEDGAIVAETGEVCLLTTAKKYADYELELEFKAVSGTNSGVFLNTEPKVKDEAVDCYEVNIAPPSNPFPTGSIVKHHKVLGMGERDSWRTYNLRVEDGVVTVRLDGKKMVSYKPDRPRPAGFIGLQKNKGRIAFRKIRIRILD